jgi:hypothetical protein
MLRVTSASHRGYKFAQVRSAALSEMSLLADGVQAG